MIAVWNGGPKLEMIEVKKNRSIYGAIRSSLRGGFCTPVDGRTSITFSRLESAGIVTLVDDNARLKKLPATWRGSNFQLHGPIVFVGDGGTFVDLNEKQVQVLRDILERVTLPPIEADSFQNTRLRLGSGRR